MTQVLLSRNPDVSVQSNTSRDLRPINPANIQVLSGTYADTKEVERIIQILKEGGNLPDIIVTPEDVLISGINALEAAKKTGQTLILVSVQKLKIEHSLIQISVVRLDGGTQSRAGVNQQVIEEYTQAWLDGVKFPPIIPFYDGESYWLADGFHRCYAAQKAGLLEIEADIRQGTRRDAVLYSVGANGSHGLRRTNEDKRRAVTNLLEDEEWKKWSDRAIAQKCGVSNGFVSKLRPVVSPVNTSVQPLSVNGTQIKPETRLVTRGGTTYTQKLASIEKPWLPKETEVVEVIGGEHKGKLAEVRVITGNAAMCRLEGDEENQRKTIFLSYLKPLEKKPETTTTTAPTSVEEEVRQIQKKAGFGTRSQLFPDMPRNEEPVSEQLPASMPNFDAIGDALAGEVAIALMRLTPEQVNQAIRRASANWSRGQIEAAYQALNEYRMVAA